MVVYWKDLKRMEFVRIAKQMREKMAELPIGYLWDIWLLSFRNQSSICISQLSYPQIWRGYFKLFLFLFSFFLGFFSLIIIESFRHIVNQILNINSKLLHVNSISLLAPQAKCWQQNKAAGAQKSSIRKWLTEDILCARCSPTPRCWGTLPKRPRSWV